MAKNIQYVNYVHKGLTIWIQVTKVKIQTTAGKMLQKGVMDKLQKAKQVQAKVNLQTQSCWLPAWHKPVSKTKSC